MIRAKDNPFAAHRFEALGYLEQDLSWEAMLERLRRLDHTAAIVGPHGSGKTTLLRNLARRLHQNGYDTRQLFTSCDIKLPWKTIRDCVVSMPSGGILCFDGGNHLARLRFWQLRRLARAKSIGLIITSHCQGRLDTLIHCQPTPALLTTIVGRLVPGPDTIEPDYLDDLFAAHQGNIRDCLWQLYDDYSAQFEGVKENEFITA